MAANFRFSIRPLAVALSLAIATACHAQDLTVHVVTDGSHPKTASGVAVELYPQPGMPGHREVITQKSDANGTVVFHNVDLASIAWSVTVYNQLTVASDPVVIICKPENASAQGVQPSVTALPAEITLHVHKRGVSEHMSYFLRGH